MRGLFCLGSAFPPFIIACPYIVRRSPITIHRLPTLRPFHPARGRQRGVPGFDAHVGSEPVPRIFKGNVLIVHTPTLALACEGGNRSGQSLGPVLHRFLRVLSIITSGSSFTLIGAACLEALVLTGSAREVKRCGSGARRGNASKAERR